MHVLGIDIDGDIANLALLNKKKKLLDFKSYDISKVNQLYIQDKKISKKFFISTALLSKKY